MNLATNVLSLAIIKITKSRSSLINNLNTSQPFFPSLMLQPTMAIHFLLLLSALSALSVSADVFTSIDCGSSDIYTDPNSIVWMGDNDIIQNGVAQTVPPSNSISHVMDTLRVFTTRKKNCYIIKADKGGQVLVRASFYYGNYDQKSAPPTFDLQFDGNDWATIVTSSTQMVYYEVTYVVKGDSISVCVAQTKPNQFPFMSALEVRSLGSNMYSHVDANFALFLSSRTAYGAPAAVRFSDDPYDRIWETGQVGNGLLTVASDALLITTSGAEDDPPMAAVQNAITTSATSEYIILGATFPAIGILTYITLYFSEVTQLDPTTQKRSFRLYKNNQSFSQPIIPPYETVTELYATNFTASANTTFTLVATSDSTLPPIINAMEVFYISDPLTHGTNSIDVGGLGSLQKNFDVLQEWGGDPCLPAPYSWDWINCSSDAVPRVTSLYLNGFGLSGTLPDFSSMTALETIDLHNNSITGPIPNFLGTLPNLKELNLANNQFSGSIPTSLSNNNKIKLVVTGNPNLCASGKSCQTTDTSPNSPGDETPSSSTTDSGSGTKKSSILPIILGVTIPIFVVFWVIVGVCAILHHKRKTAAVASIGAGQNGGANRPNGSPQQGVLNNADIQMLGKIGQAVINNFQSNMEENEQVNVELGDQTNQQAPQNGQYSTNT
ncbi:uncharacterized protein At1g24485-like [Camellia sinensis]|uniref:uncharacterized protein At1g24485-like n=1 Tax=Camellia sinensis TaxID=4442 RepID=UPI0010359510|nr:uncharacterized protein At1g24485-like [Camellia sinensis]